MPGPIILPTTGAWTGQFAELFLEKKAEDVQVNIIYHVFGSLRTSAGFFDRLRKGGVNIAGFHYGNITHRHHRKIEAVRRRLKG